MQFVSTSGKKLYQWIYGERRDVDADPDKPPASSRGQGKFIAHRKTEEYMGAVMFVNFEVNDGKIVVEWNQRVDYKYLNDREEMLASQHVMAEILNYIVLKDLDSPIEIKINTEDKSPLSIIKQYLIYLDKDALDTFRKDREKDPESDGFIDWKREMSLCDC